MKPDPRPRGDFTIYDPAVGTAGFLVCAYEWLLAETKGAFDRDVAARDFRARLVARSGRLVRSSCACGYRDASCSSTAANSFWSRRPRCCVGTAVSSRVAGRTSPVAAVLCFIELGSRRVRLAG